jgi:hypothetical protein
LEVRHVVSHSAGACRDADRVLAVRPGETGGFPMILGLLVLIGLFLLCGAFIGAAERL